MRTATKTINIYKFDELTEDVQSKVIDRYIDQVLTNENYEDLHEDWQVAIDKAEEMRTPWFAASYIWDMCKDDILEIMNEREYTQDGEIYFTD